MVCGNSVREKILGVEYYQSGHAWVSDDYSHRERNADVYRKGNDKVHRSYTEKKDYLYLNQGRNGNSNGYYLASIFNGDEGPTFPSTRAVDKGNYPYNVEITPYINVIK